MQTKSANGLSFACCYSKQTHFVTSKLSTSTQPRLVGTSANGSSLSKPILAPIHLPTRAVNCVPHGVKRLPSALYEKLHTAPFETFTLRNIVSDTVGEYLMVCAAVGLNVASDVTVSLLPLSASRHTVCCNTKWSF